MTHLPHLLQLNAPHYGVKKAVKPAKVKDTDEKTDSKIILSVADWGWSPSGARSVLEQKIDEFEKTHVIVHRSKVRTTRPHPGTFHPQWRASFPTLHNPPKKYQSITLTYRNKTETD